MLIKVTCPACGRSTEASERVVGKEVRCTCGTGFRVTGLKSGDSARPQPARQPAGGDSSGMQARSRPAQSPVRQPPPRPQPAASASSWPAERPQPAALPQRYAPPSAPLPRVKSSAQKSGTPPWAYGAIGGLAVLSLVLVIVLIRSLIPTPSRDRAAGAEADRVLASHSGPPAGAEAAEREALAHRASASALSTAEIVARCEPSVALVKGRASSGTGFMIRKGIIATNAHVIEDEFVSSLEVRFPSAPDPKKGPLRARLLYEDRKRDLAFLAIQSDLPVLDVVPSYQFLKGEDITVIGNPGLDADTVLENAISRGVMSSKTVIEEQDYYQMNISINPGNSGGPVFDSAGRVIGVATLKASKQEAVAFCIPIEDVTSAMKDLGAARPDLTSRHRVEVAFRLLTTAGVVYSIGLEIRNAVMRSSPFGGMNATQLPTEETKKFDEILTKLDQKLFSLLDAEIPYLRKDPALAEVTRTRFQEIGDNYKAMKNLYQNPAQWAHDFAFRVRQLKEQHVRLVESLENDLKIPVPPEMMAILKKPPVEGLPPALLADMVPAPLQPRFRIGPPNMGPRNMGPRNVGPRNVGPRNMGPRGGMPNDPGRQVQQRIQEAQRRAQRLRPPM